MLSTKKLTSLISFGFIAATCFFHSKPVNAVTETFSSPTVRLNDSKTYKVGICVISPRYQTPCTQASMSLAATAFCWSKNHDRLVNFKWDEATKSNVAILTQEYRSGQLLTGWQPLESSYIFTEITCAS